MTTQFVFFSTLLTAASAACPELPKMELSQGRNVLAQITAVSTAETVQEFYNYGGGEEKSSFGGTSMPLIAQNLMMLVHQDSNTCDTSLVIVADKPNDQNGGRLGITISPGDFTDPSVKDDEFMGFKYNDNKDNTWINMAWNECCTDGFAHTFDISSSGCVTIQTEVGRGINTWLFMSANDGMVGLDLNQDLQLCVGGASLCGQRTCQWWDLACRGEMFFQCRDLPALGDAVGGVTFAWQERRKQNGN